MDQDRRNRLTEAAKHIHDRSRGGNLPPFSHYTDGFPILQLNVTVRILHSKSRSACVKGNHVARSLERMRRIHYFRTIARIDWHMSWLIVADI